MLEFQKFNKIPRLSRDISISEKINGSNAQIYIVSSKDLFNWFEENKTAYFDDAREFVNKYCLGIYSNNSNEEKDLLYIFAGSKNRWLDCSSNGDNYGFAKWVKANAEELMKLGEGRHYGEFWGKGIQCGYGLDEKRFSLFNTGRWINYDKCYSDEYEGKKLMNCPKCCSVVPILYEGMFDTTKIAEVLEKLRIDGSSAAKGYLMPEGIIIYHTASGKMFKKTILNDEKPKAKINEKS